MGDTGDCIDAYYQQCCESEYDCIKCGQSCSCNWYKTIRGKKVPLCPDCEQNPPHWVGERLDWWE